MEEKRWVKLNNEIVMKKNGEFQLEKDKEALESYFLEHINKNTVFFYTIKEKIDYYIENGYYENFYKDYDLKDIEKLYDFVLSKKFRFQSFMAANKFFEQYAMKDFSGKKYLERYEDRVVTVALYLAKGDIKKAFKYAKVLINQEFQPATPTFLNCGKKSRGELVSCFLDEMGDNLENIGYSFYEGMKLSAMGGGVAINISKMRARGGTIKNIEGVAGGVLPLMKILEDIFSYANQLGQRPGNCATYLYIFHADINEFLDSKKINVDEKIRLKSLLLGVILNNKFFELARKGEPMYVFYPNTVYKEYGKYLEDLDMEEMYEKLIDNPKIKKKEVDPRELLIKMATSQKESGYPYLFFKDNVNKVNPLKGVGDIRFSNICTEILQVSKLSKVKGYNEKNTFNYGINCNLGSLNIANVMKPDKFEEIINTSMDMLTEVADISDIKQVPSISKGNRLFKSVGLGAMNLHGFLAKNKITYESKEAKDFCNVFFSLMNYYSLKRSNHIAKKRKETFFEFEKSEYKNGNYFKQYLEEEFFPKTSKIKKIFEGFFLPTKEDWKKLKERIQKYGLYHSYRIAIPPTQSISYVQNSTSSIMPIVDLIEKREYGNSSTAFPMPFLSKETMFYYKSAYDMDQKNIMDLLMVCQKHIDQGITFTLFSKSEDSIKDLIKYYLYANKIGLKTIYYLRTRKGLLKEQCVSCSV